MRVLQSRSFAKKTKRFTKKQKTILDKQIKSIINNPDIGQEKKGNLRGVFVHKFKIESIQYLLSYRFDKDNLELIMIGPHENYYRNLETYLKSRK
ncbi:MAG: type II toxin-antitoxin system RelE/ParE family toxin [Bacteroidales bacterium]|nr:type II toxin-antitoxin system RelE/ParE family toxin [Bacteroidales bacterium]